MVRLVSWQSEKMRYEHEQASRETGSGMRLTERTRKLIAETR